jgi:hypothetical protein
MLHLQLMQPVQQPFQTVGQAMPGANMDIPEHMPDFVQPRNHMPQSGHFLLVSRAVFPAGYMPRMDVIEPQFYTVRYSLFYFNVYISNASLFQ